MRLKTKRTREYLRQCRKDQMMTMRELSDLAGYLTRKPKSNIGQPVNAIEMGAGPVGVSYIKKVLKVLPNVNKDKVIELMTEDFRECLENELREKS